MSGAILTSVYPGLSGMLLKAQRGWICMVTGPGSQAVASFVCPGAAGRWGIWVGLHLSHRQLYMEKKIETRPSWGLLQKTGTV